MKPAAKYLLPPAVLVAGLLGAATLVITSPEIEVEAPERPAPLVRVVEVQLQTLRHRVSTQGTVAPRTESDLVPEVSGPIVWVAPSFVSGGFFEEGEILLRIDPRDYEVALERARASRARSRSEHKRAQRELERRRGLAERDFASPAELDDAENAERVAAASLREARAALDQAQLDLERSEIAAPFAGRVRETGVNVGEFVNRGAPIAKLYAIDYAEVRLPVLDEELAFLDLPLWHRGEIPEGERPEVELRSRFAGAERTWTGRVVRTEGEIDPESRMVHVIARVDDPYRRTVDDGRPPLAVGLFVEADILGREVEDVIVVPRAAMRTPDQVLVSDAENRVRLRRTEVLRAGRDEVVIRSGLAPGERVIVSSLDTAVDGMVVRPVPAEEAPP